MNAEAFQQWLLGAVKSKLIWLGVVIATMPEWLPFVAPQMNKLIGDDTLTTILGILVIILRFATTKSIPEKGGQ
jgi:hypothetical protein